MGGAGGVFAQVGDAFSHLGPAAQADFGPGERERGFGGEKRPDGGVGTGMRPP